MLIDFGWTDFGKHGYHKGIGIGLEKYDSVN